jgi:hypothetical protein
MEDAGVRLQIALKKGTLEIVVLPDSGRSGEGDGQGSLF